MTLQVVKQFKGLTRGEKIEQQKISKAESEEIVIEFDLQQSGAL